MSARRFNRGAFVSTLYDVGARMGHTTLYGVVVAAGPRTATIEWESRMRNRIAQDRTDVRVVAGEHQEEAAKALARNTA